MASSAILLPGNISGKVRFKVADGEASAIWNAVKGMYGCDTLSRRPLGYWLDLTISDFIIVMVFLGFNLLYLSIFWSKWVWEEVEEVSFIE